jgi:argininosuccinate synthase
MGLVHEPLFHDLNAFIARSQDRVSGRVDVMLYKGCCRVLGRSSQEGIYSGDLVSFDTTTIDQCHAIGVSAYYGIQARLVEQGRKKKD